MMTNLKIILYMLITVYIIALNTLFILYEYMNNCTKQKEWFESKLTKS